MLHVEPNGQACGAVVRGVDFKEPQSAETIAAVRAAWLRHHVLIFPDQALADDQLERFAEYFGPIGHDPYIQAMPGKKRIAAIQRRADETGKIFADVWHSDWSFQQTPPSGTCLLGITIPDEGGDTLFSNQHLAWRETPDAMKTKFGKLIALHSAGDAYNNSGKYAKDRKNSSMAIVTSDSANAVEKHPLVQAHPESGLEGIRGGIYVRGFDGLDPAESKALVDEVYEWQGRPEFVYRHKWEPGMLVIWDNRSVLHKATGGFEGKARLLHRLTIADDAAYHARLAA